MRQSVTPHPTMKPPSQVGNGENYPSFDSPDRGVASLCWALARSRADSNVRFDPLGFQIYVERKSVREWSFAKKPLKPFAKLTNDGDEEGMLFLDRLPTADEAEVIRQYVRVAKKRVLSDEERARLLSATVGHRFKKRSDVGGDDQCEKPASDDLADAS